MHIGFEKITILILVLCPIILTGCSGFSQVIQQNGDTAIIKGTAATKAEATLKAQERAKELFGTYIETQPAECSQQFNASGSGGDFSASTYYVCVIYVKSNKQPSETNATKDLKDSNKQNQETEKQNSGS
jgi:hypothetical protein